MRRNGTLLSLLALLLVDLDAGHAETPAESGPRVVAARDVPAAPRQPPNLLLDPPRPRRLAHLDGIEAFRFSPAGPAIPVAAKQAPTVPVPSGTSPAILQVLELSEDWVRVLVEGDGVALAVYLDAALARTVVVRKTFLMPSRPDLPRAGKPRVPGVRMSIGDVVEVLPGQGKVAGVRHVGFDFEATGFLRQQDLGKAYPSTDDSDDTRNMCGRETEPDHLLEVGAQLRGRPGGPVFLEVKQSPFTGAHVMVTVLARRERHTLVCRNDFVGWADVQDLRPHYEQPAMWGALLKEQPHPAMPSSKQVRLPQHTYFYDRPGGNIIGHVSREITRPIGNAAPGDWVETRLSTSLGEISVWFEVPR